jgi:hypothetical protein
LVRAAIANDPGREYAGQRVANIHDCLWLQRTRLWIQYGCPSVRYRTLGACGGNAPYTAARHVALPAQPPRQSN